MPKLTNVVDNIPSGGINPLTFPVNGDYYLVPVLTPDMLTDDGVAITAPCDGYFYKEGTRKPNGRTAMVAYVVGVSADNPDKISPADVEGTIMSVIAPNTLAKNILSVLTTAFFDVDDRKAYSPDGQVFKPSETIDGTGFTGEVIALDKDGNISDFNGTIIKISRVKTQKGTEYHITSPTGRELKSLSGFGVKASDVPAFDKSLADIVKDQNAWIDNLISQANSVDGDGVL